MLTGFLLVRQSPRTKLVEFIDLEVFVLFIFALTGKSTANYVKFPPKLDFNVKYVVKTASFVQTGINS